MEKKVCCYAGISRSLAGRRGMVNWQNAFNCFHNYGRKLCSCSCNGNISGLTWKNFMMEMHQIFTFPKFPKKNNISMKFPSLCHSCYTKISISISTPHISKSRIDRRTFRGNFSAEAGLKIEGRSVLFG